MAQHDITKLIVRVALKDRAAFDQLYRQTSATLFGVCLRILGDRAEAEEALQEVFVRVWAKADRFAASELDPLGWLVAIARAHAIDVLRSRPPVVPPATDAPAPKSKSRRKAKARLKAGSPPILVCLNELDPDSAAELRQAFLEGESYATLAGRAGVPPNAIRARMRGSLIRLKDCLQQ